MNRIGIFGGTFNPVHKGHVAVAECFIKELSLDLLYVIPNRIPPMKNNESVLGEDRIKMLEIAFSGNDKVVISQMELDRGGTSYTCDTIADLRKLHPESEMFLLTGDDWIDRFHQWKNYEFIIDNATLVVGVRSGEVISDRAKKLKEKTGKEIILLKNPKIEISSTEFRAERDPSVLPEGVFDYIKERGLYGI